MQTENHNYALIIAGGAGTRLWPISRKTRPKQFQIFSDNESLLQHMYRLVKQTLPPERILVIATQEFSETISQQLPDLPKENLVYEPARKDNGPAVLLGMAQLYLKDKDAIGAVLWSDHLIKNADNFKQTLEASFQAAKKSPQALVTIGAKPIYPDTGMGYIQMCNEITTIDNQAIFAVKKFVEKPDLETATRFITSWEYLWNTGYKIMNVASFLNLFAEIQPDLQDIIKALKTTSDHKSIKEQYEKLPKDGIEFMFTPFVKEIQVVPSDMSWSDIGNWSVLHDLFKNEFENNLVTRGDVINVDSKDCLVYGKDNAIAIVGLSDIIIVDEGDCILVMNKNECQKIKQVISQLESSKEDLL